MPGQLEWEPPTPEDLLHCHFSSGFATHDQIVDPAIATEVRERSLAIQRGFVEVDPYESHGDLLRLKTAGLLAVLDGRLDVSLVDWDLAAVVTATSSAVRRQVQDIVGAEARQREQATSDKLALRQVAGTAAVVRDQVERTADRIVKIVRDHGGDMSRREVRSGCRHRQREELKEAITHAIDSGQLVELAAPGQGGDDKRLLRYVGERS